MQVPQRPVRAAIDLWTQPSDASKSPSNLEAWVLRVPIGRLQDILGDPGATAIQYQRHRDAFDV
jgi:hypothetical protein